VSFKYLAAPLGVPRNVTTGGTPVGNHWSTFLEKKKNEPHLMFSGIGSERMLQQRCSNLDEDTPRASEISQLGS